MAGETVIIAEFTTTKESHKALLELGTYDKIHSERDEPGCKEFKIVTSNDDPNLVVFVETYADDAAVEAHKKTPHYAHFFEKLDTLDVKKNVRLFTQSGK